MHFTLIFQSHESEDLSISICFTPCIVWVKGRDEILNPHPENPNYLIGDLNTYLGKFNIVPVAKKAVVVVHPDGHGQQNDLDQLTKDLRSLDFHYQTIFL